MVGLLVASPIFASLAKSVNPFRLIGVGLLVWTAAVIGCGCSWGFWSIVIFHMLVGVGEASFISLAAPLLTIMPLQLSGTNGISLVFLCLGTATSSISGTIAVLRIWNVVPAIPISERWMHFVMAHHPGVIVFLVMHMIIFISSTTLMVAQASQIARNITTNELANASRYSYLWGPDGWFRNPYNHGCRKNCADVLIQGFTDDNEIARHPLLQTCSKCPASSTSMKSVIQWD